MQAASHRDAAAGALCRARADQVESGAGLSARRPGKRRIGRAAGTVNQLSPIGATFPKSTLPRSSAW